jgi:hypothetical protein
MPMGWRSPSATLGDGTVPKTRKQPPASTCGASAGRAPGPQLDVECVGTGTTIHARTIDLSPTGMLVGPMTERAPGRRGRLVPLAYLVAVAFQGGMKAVFSPRWRPRGDRPRDDEPLGASSDSVAASRGG